MRYLVSIREVHINHVVVEADSEISAMQKASDDRTRGDEINLEYSYDLDRDTWSVFKFDGNTLTI